MYFDDAGDPRCVDKSLDAQVRANCKETISFLTPPPLTKQIVSFFTFSVEES